MRSNKARKLVSPDGFLFGWNEGYLTERMGGVCGESYYSRRNCGYLTLQNLTTTVRDTIWWPALGVLRNE